MKRQELNREEHPYQVIDFINGPVEYDKFGGQYFWIKTPDGGAQMLIEMRGWGRIQNIMKLNLTAAGEFQDMVADFIAAAINEKIDREFPIIKP